jgi:hypothetical protein
MDVGEAALAEVRKEDEQAKIFLSYSHLAFLDYGGVHEQAKREQG